MTYLSKKNKEYLFIGILLLVIFILAIIGKPIPCIFHKITGLYCPGCGVTRMILSLLKFDFAKAFSYNQLCFIYLFLFIGYLLYVLIFKLLKKPIKKVPDKVMLVLLLIAIVFGILRNVI